MLNNEIEKRLSGDYIFIKKNYLYVNKFYLMKRIY
jgi:hypothetical protein